MFYYFFILFQISTINLIFTFSTVLPVFCSFSTGLVFFCSSFLLSYFLTFLLFIKRPGVAEAVLQIPLSLIHWLNDSSFSSKSSKYHKSQTEWARELTFWEIVQPPQHFTCHMSHATCNMSHVTYNIFFFFYFFQNLQTMWVKGVLSTWPTPSSCF